MEDFEEYLRRERKRYENYYQQQAYDFNGFPWNRKGLFSYISRIVNKSIFVDKYFQNSTCCKNQLGDFPY
jgi:hypothetical protein